MGLRLAKLPFLIEVECPYYHEFEDVARHLNTAIEGGTVKIYEVDECYSHEDNTGMYYGVVYTGNIPSKRVIKALLEDAGVHKLEDNDND